jgi:hypothetical protein
MARAFGLVLMLIAMYIGMTIYTQGIEQVFGGIFAPLQPDTEPTSRASAIADTIKMNARDETPPARVRVPITEQVRDRVTQHIQRGAARNERALR